MTRKCTFLVKGLGALVAVTFAVTTGMADAATTASPTASNPAGPEVCIGGGGSDVCADGCLGAAYPIVSTRPDLKLLYDHDDISDPNERRFGIFQHVPGSGDNRRYALTGQSLNDAETCDPYPWGYQWYVYYAQQLLNPGTEPKRLVVTVLCQECYDFPTSSHHFAAPVQADVTVRCVDCVPPWLASLDAPMAAQLRIEWNAQ